MVFEKLTDIDKQNIEDYIDLFIDYHGPCIDGSRASLEHVLREWNYEKGEFLEKVFGGDLIMRKSISIEKEHSTLMREFYDFKRRNDAINSFKRFICDRSLWNTDKAQDIIYTLVSDECLVDNKYTGSTFELEVFTNGTCEKVKIQSGCKVMRVLGKISKLLGDKAEALFEDFRINISQFLNDKELRGELNVSIHPLDYMAASDNDCDWCSCMSWLNDGCYRTGTIEMMNSRFVVVAYLTAKDNFFPDSRQYPDMELPNKKWRSFFICSPNIITSIKGYPYTSEALATEVLNMLKERVEATTDIKYVNKIVAADDDKYTFDNSGYIYFETDYMYNDFGTSGHWAYIREGYNPDYCECFNYSGRATCMWCGDTIEIDTDGEDSNHIFCDNCLGITTCEHCGRTIYNGEINWVDDTCLCDECYERCPVNDLEGERFFGDNMVVYLLPKRFNKCVNIIPIRNRYISVPLEYSMEDCGIDIWKTYFKSDMTEFDKQDDLYERYVYPEDLTPAGLRLFGIYNKGDADFYMKDIVEGRFNAMKKNTPNYFEKMFGKNATLEIETVHADNNCRYRYIINAETDGEILRDNGEIEIDEAIDEVILGC